MVKEKSEKKNVLVIVVDCLRSDYIFKNKSKIPTINKLREKGFSFVNTITSASTTTPSFASILTATYPFKSGVRSHSGYSLNKKINTFSQILSDNGYNTYAEVTGPLVKEVGLDKGFKEYNYRDRKETIHTYWGEKILKNFKSDYKTPWFVLLHIWTLHLPRRVVKECKTKEFGNSPYARALSSIDVYIKRLLDVLSDDTIIVITGDHGEQIGKTNFEEFYRKKIMRILILGKKLNLIKKPFSKLVRNIQVGHGYSIYDILVNVPCIFYNESMIKKGESRTQIRQIDIMPTIVDLLNIENSKDAIGKSVMSIINGNEEKNRDAYMEAVGTVIPNKKDWVSGIRVDNKYKFIFSPYREDFEELYSLEDDPYERTDISKENPEIVRELREKIKSVKIKKMVGEKIDEDAQKEMKKRLKKLGYF